jgi:hypothetical protein
LDNLPPIKIEFYYLIFNTDDNGSRLSSWTQHYKMSTNTRTISKLISTLKLDEKKLADLMKRLIFQIIGRQSNLSFVTSFGILMMTVEDSPPLSKIVKLL